MRESFVIALRATSLISLTHNRNIQSGSAKLLCFIPGQHSLCICPLHTLSTIVFSLTTLPTARESQAHSSADRDSLHLDSKGFVLALSVCGHITLLQSRSPLPKTSVHHCVSCPTKFLSIFRCFWAHKRFLKFQSQNAQASKHLKPS